MSSADNELGVAILGAGIFVNQAHLPALASLGNAAPTLKAVYSRSKKSVLEVANAAKDTLKLSELPAVYHGEGDGAGDLDALLARSDISAVIVVLPITIQPSIVLKALEAGKHVLSEKPVAPDVVEGLNLIHRYNTEYKPKGLIWRVAENFEAEPAFQAAKKAVREGKIGKVQFFRAVAANYIDTEKNNYYKTPWRTVPDYQGGFLLDGGVHTTAMLRTILPSPFTHLSAFASLNREVLKPHDTINAILKAGSATDVGKSDYHGTLDLTFAVPTSAKPATDYVVITGSKGWISIRSLSSPGGGYRVTVLSKKGDEEAEEVLEEQSRGVEVEQRSFFNAVLGKQDELPGIGVPEDALVDVAIIQASLNSEGKLVDLQVLLRRE